MRTKGWIRKNFVLYRDRFTKKELDELSAVRVRTAIKEFKDRIAELEKENAVKTDTITDLLNKQEAYEKEKLTKFAERLKEKGVNMNKDVNIKKLTKHWDKSLQQLVKICRSHHDCNKCPFHIDVHDGIICLIGRTNAAMETLSKEKTK